MDNNASSVTASHVFVYGTLKSDQPNGMMLQESSNGKAVFIAEGKTIEPYPFILAMKWNIPFLLQKPGYGKHVYGEIYKVDDNMIKTLDIIERCPDVYVRKIIDVELLHEFPGSIEYHDERHVDIFNGITTSVGKRANVVKCWAYMLKHFPNTVLKSKEFVERYDSVKHNLQISKEEFHQISDDFVNASYIYDQLEKDSY